MNKIILPIDEAIRRLQTGVDYSGAPYIGDVDFIKCHKDVYGNLWCDITTRSNPYPAIQVGVDDVTFVKNFNKCHMGVDITTGKRYINCYFSHPDYDRALDKEYR